MSASDGQMTRSDQADLLRLIRQRERVAKAAAAAWAAQLRADFEQQLDTRYAFDQSPIWEAAYRAAEVAHAAANQKIEEECRLIGIPKEFSPSLGQLYWCNRGENAVKERRSELRRLAHKHIEAAEKRATAEITRLSVEAQGDLIANGLSETGRAFLAELPSPETMMPGLRVAEVEVLLVSQRKRRL